uniref:Uncharacterized protein n=1 Tax=Setaria italica TaxID=4555 RepID=K3XUK9_SETIT
MGNVEGAGLGGAMPPVERRLLRRMEGLGRFAGGGRRWSSGGSGRGRNPSEAALASVAEIDLRVAARTR